MYYTRADSGVTGQRSYRRFRSFLEAQAWIWRMETVPTYVTGQDEWTSLRRSLQYLFCIRRQWWCKLRCLSKSRSIFKICARDQIERPLLYLRSIEKGIVSLKREQQWLIENGWRRRSCKFLEWPTGQFHRSMHSSDSFQAIAWFEIRKTLSNRSNMVSFLCSFKPPLRHFVDILDPLTNFVDNLIPWHPPTLH